MEDQDSVLLGVKEALKGIFYIVLREGNENQKDTDNLENALVVPIENAINEGGSDIY